MYIGCEQKRVGTLKTLEPCTRWDFWIHVSMSERALTKSTGCKNMHAVRALLLFCNVNATAFVIEWHIFPLSHFLLLIDVGMPYPQNFETAREVEKIVMDNGAVPATIAILNGVPCIGLS